jgi:hypothetical protein
MAYSRVCGVAHVPLDVLAGRRPLVAAVRPGT